MLDFRPDTDLQRLELFRQAPQFTSTVGPRLAFGTFHGHVPRHRFTDVLGPLFHARIAGIAELGSLVAVQQGVRPRHVGDIPGRADDGIHPARSSIDADVGHHAEVPGIALFRRKHLWSTLAALVKALLGHVHCSMRPARSVPPPSTF